MALKEYWKIDEEIKDKYIQACLRFVQDEEAFRNFRRDPDYGKILEGNEKDVGDIALNYLTQLGGTQFLYTHLTEFLRNDTIGNPKLYDGPMSAATLRYIASAYQISRLLNGFKPKRILEIGGGYGGLCRILSVLYSFETYTDIDLPEAEALFDKYIGHFFRKGTNHTIEGKYDLFIADSSLSECNAEAQERYFYEASKCDYIFIVYNTFHKDGNHELFCRMRDSLLRNHKGDTVPGILTAAGMQSFTNTYLFKRNDL